MVRILLAVFLALPIWPAQAADGTASAVAVNSWGFNQ